MCLDKIDREPKPFRAGYKVFVKYSEGLCSQFRHDKKPLIVGEWLDADDFNFADNLPYKKELSDNAGYTLHWHVLKKLKQAKLYRTIGITVVFKVECRDMHTVGEERGKGNIVGVCRYIKILEEVA